MTRKLFTMLLSVIVYNHTLTKGQWLGAAVVFAGISVEAFVKRKSQFFDLRFLRVVLILSSQLSIPSLSLRRKRLPKSNLCNIKAYLDLRYRTNVMHGIETMGGSVSMYNKTLTSKRRQPGRVTKHKNKTRRTRPAMPAMSALHSGLPVALTRSALAVVCDRHPCTTDRSEGVGKG